MSASIKLVDVAARSRDVIQAARAMIPVLRDRAMRVEELREMPQETLAEFKQAGFYRMCVPPAYGGWGLDVETAIRVSFELSRACASSGWAAAQIGVESIMAAGFPKQAQDEFWAHSADVGAVSANALVESTVTPAEGGFRLMGRWKFGSGVDQASWLILTQAERGTQNMFLIPRADFEIVDDWFTVGLKGTGSKEIVIRDAFVPAHRVGKLTSIRSHAMSVWILGCIAWGAAQGAYEDFERIMSTRRSLKDQSRPADRDGVQVALARSAVELECCEMLFNKNVAMFRAAGGENRELTKEEGLIVSRDCCYVAELCYRGTHRLFDEFGSSVIYSTNPIQRALRDIMAATRHGRCSWEQNAKAFGMWRLGIHPAFPRIDA